ncbi:MAG: hypothetical protein DRN81_04055, partial [Thermoproteota archaeon]
MVAWREKNVKHNGRLDQTKKRVVMSNKNIMLVASARMDKNNKRDENILIRMSKAARDNLGIGKIVSLSPKPDSTSSNTALRVFRAYSKDLDEAREKFKPRDMARICFVTSRTYRKITNGKSYVESVWISTTENRNITVGADPEFLLFKNDEVVRANSILPYNGSIGSDGAMAEIRPQPSAHPGELVKNIRDII